ncbi:hypothetical protein LC607_17760 [Nostoc sp. CHAB 5824]|nr:hypothetical protein [Nostoc sp. CHAB 5824]
MKELAQAFDSLVEKYRLNFITDLIAQAMPIIENQGFTLEELLDGLANYIETETEWQQAVHHLEEAATAIRKARKASM